MTKFLLAGAAMLAISTAALADEPQKLTEDQLGSVAGGFEVNNSSLPFILPLLVLDVQTTEVSSTQTNAASSDQVGAGIGFGGLGLVFQRSEITQVNAN